MIPKLLPCVIIFISLSASCVYLIYGDYRRSIYWLAAAVLNAAVTF